MPTPISLSPCSERRRLERLSRWTWRCWWEVGLGADGRSDQLFHILYDGTVVDEDDWVVLGGETEEISERMGQAASRE